MSKAIIDEQSLIDIANAIRSKNGEPSTTTYTPSEMVDAIENIPSDGIGIIRQCEWIENSSKSYIRTNIIPQANDVLTVDFQLSSVTGNPVFAGCSNTEGGTTNRFLVGQQGSGEGYHYQAADKTWRNTTEVADTDRHTIVFDSSGEILLDNVSILTFTPNFGTLNYPLGIFTKWWNSASTATGSYMQGKIFGVTLTRSNSVILNLVPAYIVNGTIGMYDTISSEFFTNMGDIAFTKGPDVHSGGGLPSEYEQVDYIESSGTQYIDTGYKPTKFTSVMVEHQYTEISTSSLSYYVFGTDDGTAGGFFGVYSNNSRTYCRHYWDTNAYAYMTSITDKLYLSFGGGNYAVGDGSTANYRLEQYNNNYGNPNDYTNLSNLNLYLFCTNGNGTAKNFGKVKLYACKIFNNNTGEFYRNFIPCYRKSDNEVGLYDLVGKQFYTNSGTGSFTCYPAIPS